jgi:hypothetical protein
VEVVGLVLGRADGNLLGLVVGWEVVGVFDGSWEGLVLGVEVVGLVLGRADGNLLGLVVGGEVVEGQLFAPKVQDPAGQVATEHSGVQSLS